MGLGRDRSSLIWFECGDWFPEMGDLVFLDPKDHICSLFCCWETSKKRLRRKSLATTVAGHGSPFFLKKMSIVLSWHFLVADTDYFDRFIYNSSFSYWHYTPTGALPDLSFHGKLIVSWIYTLSVDLPSPERLRIGVNRLWSCLCEKVPEFFTHFTEKISLMAVPLSPVPPWGAIWNPSLLYGAQPRWRRRRRWWISCFLFSSRRHLCSAWREAELYEKNIEIT